MNKLVLPIALVAVCLATGSAPTLADSAQQEKMKSCNAEAKVKNLAGEERKKFMSECLSAKPGAKTETKAEEKKLTPQQEKMKSCNAQAAGKKLAGEERKKFMSSCLKG